MRSERNGEFCEIDILMGVLIRMERALINFAQVIEVESTQELE